MYDTMETSTKAANRHLKNALRSLKKDLKNSLREVARIEKRKSRGHLTEADLRGLEQKQEEAKQNYNRARQMLDQFSAATIVTYPNARSAKSVAKKFGYGTVEGFVQDHSSASLSDSINGIMKYYGGVYVDREGKKIDPALLTAENAASYIGK